MSSLKLVSCLFLVLLCAFDSKVQGDEELPLTKFSSKSGPTLNFFYCYSCGYKKVFEEYVSILRQKYPELQVNGENYKPPGYNMYVAHFLGIAKILVIVLILSGINIFQWIGQPAPFVWQWCINNRLYASILLFFICNAVEGQLISSGAFEIHLNDVPVWSKLETGRIPQPQELFQIIDNHIQMMMPEMDMGKPMSFNK